MMHRREIFDKFFDKLSYKTDWELQITETVKQKYFWVRQTLGTEGLAGIASMKV